MKPATLEEIYRSANEKTVATWAKNSGIGKVKEGHYYDPVKLALATGIQPPLSAAVSRLLDALQQRFQHDPLADILPVRGFHFTFLPLTLPLYDEREPLPEKVAQLAAIWSGYNANTLVIRHLRLVALPNQLLLAGIPESPAVDQRQSFCEQVMQSDWKAELLMRHAGRALPAPFWHSTILRYHADFLPESLRHYFSEHQNRDYGGISGELTLAGVNYNWTTCYPLSG
ncbi:hypothetical protein CKF43_03735 [Pantoea graminicola]|uniref:hypothetical protein n=1 Tax=Pantoea sp. ARC607 TaxID=2027922 RepID=UPI000DA769B1|nr:hypothetical protein [Pantoea sp. ARC607]PZL97751.1 hypothetical protein CKF43_03735 [Pantoea sp. ARC607]